MRRAQTPTPHQPRVESVARKVTGLVVATAAAKRLAIVIVVVQKAARKLSIAKSEAPS